MEKTEFHPSSIANVLQHNEMRRNAAEQCVRSKSLVLLDVFLSNVNWRTPASMGRTDDTREYDWIRDPFLKAPVAWTEGWDLLVSRKPDVAASDFYQRYNWLSDLASKREYNPAMMVHILLQTQKENTPDAAREILHDALVPNLYGALHRGSAPLLEQYLALLPLPLSFDVAIDWLHHITYWDCYSNEPAVRANRAPLLQVLVAFLKTVPRSTLGGKLDHTLWIFASTPQLQAECGLLREFITGVWSKEADHFERMLYNVTMDCHQVGHYLLLPERGLLQSERGGGLACTMQVLRRCKQTKMLAARIRCLRNNGWDDTNLVHLLQRSGRLVIPAELAAALLREEPPAVAPLSILTRGRKHLVD